MIRLFVNVDRDDSACKFYSVASCNGKPGACDNTYISAPVVFKGGCQAELFVGRAEHRYRAFSAEAGFVLVDIHKVARKGPIDSRSEFKADERNKRVAGIDFSSCPVRAAISVEIFDVDRVRECVAAVEPGRKEMDRAELEQLAKNDPYRFIPGPCPADIGSQFVRVELLIFADRSIRSDCEFNCGPPRVRLVLDDLDIKDKGKIIDDPLRRSVCVVPGELGDELKVDRIDDPVLDGELYIDVVEFRDGARMPFRVIDPIFRCSEQIRFDVPVSGRNDVR